MKTKVKIIEHDEYDKLEVLVNEFIEKIPGPDLIDIKFSTWYGDNACYYSAMVVYDEE